MKKIRFIFLFLCLGYSYSAFSQFDLFKNQLTDLDNKSFPLSDLSKNKASVFIFLLSDCPASQDYTLTLNELSKKYKSQNILFYGVFPGKFGTDAELKEFNKDYKINFSLLKDPEMELAKGLEAKIVPCCYLINQTGKIVYKGRIDDLLYALGKKRMLVTQRNLDDAIKSLLSNRPVKKTETNPIGCILEY